MSESATYRTEPSSFGWNPEEKKEELFHPDSRFILVRTTNNPQAENCDDGISTLVAFSMFRFDYEEYEECPGEGVNSVYR